MALLRNGRETGLSVPFDVTGTYRNVNSILISPAGDEVLYTLWENARVEIFVSNTDGTHARKIAEQEAAEGSGELDLSSLSWSEDGAKISYIESGMVCGARICDMPNDFFLQRTLYTVDLTTGQKTSRIIE